ncbi:chorismate mutase [Sphingomonas quercus]|uniref:Chorismate mutase n=1 Tax=Sphingomonas quercus TaxID=2842451 RepID=A0ABS6BL97_9SPHN|nr:chorismate mutase [Sphingomonas quercus]MBU3079068.1 chorismate mutase [Sphingomonas quercus]
MTQENTVPADQCTTMAEVRAGIDALDRRIVALLAERLRFIEAAARIKPQRDHVRDEWRKADVIAKACATAAAHDFPEALAAAVYEVLVEGSIAYEFERFDARQG